MSRPTVRKERKRLKSMEIPHTPNLTPLTHPRPLTFFYTEHTKSRVQSPVQVLFYLTPWRAMSSMKNSSSTLKSDFTAGFFPLTSLARHSLSTRTDLSTCTCYTKTEGHCMSLVLLKALKLDFPRRNAFLQLVFNFFFFSSEHKNWQCPNLTHVISVLELSKRSWVFV